MSRLPHPANHYHLTGDLPSHALLSVVVAIPLRMVSSTLSARGGGTVGFTAWRVWPGRHCPGWHAALYLSPERARDSPDMSCLAEGTEPSPQGTAHAASFPQDSLREPFGP